MDLIKMIHSFPDDFIFGTATSSYQIEGSLFGGCGKSHWDTFAKKPSATFKNQDGSIACNHIKYWKEDIDLISDSGFSAYRFSFSWPRLLLDGKKIRNNNGFDFYDRLLDKMLDKQLLPFATLYHWDLPEVLAEKGGWTNRDTCKWFADYTEKVMSAFGNRLHSIATINEPWCVSWLSHYMGLHAPGLNSLSAAAKSMHLILVAHSKATEVMRSFNHKNIGIVLNKEYCIPATRDFRDISACKLYDEIYNLWFDEAIFKGKYPNRLLEIFKDFMPENFESDLTEISQKLDWIGINYYTRAVVKADISEVNIGLKLIPGDLNKTDMGWEIFPDGLKKLLKRQKDDYSDNLPIHITENGMANKDQLINGQINDLKRVDYYLCHLKEIKTLLDQGLPIKSYFAWSLLDNFEWAYGYQKRFGLVYVDFSTQERIPKQSYYTFQKALQTKK